MNMLVMKKQRKKQIDIEFMSSVNKSFALIAPYYDKLYIIKNSDNIEKYDGDEYYDIMKIKIYINYVVYYCFVLLAYLLDK
jgi:hypothetical protein